jgi:hypothetical protein
MTRGTSRDEEKTKEIICIERGRRFEEIVEMSGKSRQ